MREPTDAEVEAVARVMLSAVTSAVDTGNFYEWQDFAEEARAAIIALDEVRGK